MAIIIVWVLVALAILGLLWVTIEIVSTLRVNTKDMPLKERVLWVYPPWIKNLFSLEYDDDDTVVVLQGVSPSKISILQRKGIDHYVVLPAEAQERHIPQGILIRKRDLDVTLVSLNSSIDQSMMWEDREDVFIIGVLPNDAESRVESLINEYLLGIRASHTDTEKKTLEKRRAFQEALASVVKLMRDESVIELSTQEALSAREKWAYKLYEDLRHHPDILRVDLQKQPGYIIVYTDDLIVEESGNLPSEQNRRKKMFFLGKMIIKINLTNGETRYYHENGRMSSKSDHHAPHVNNEGKSCWGSHAGVVEGAVGNKNYLKAIQEAINFLKWANTKDAWGQTAFQLSEMTDQDVESVQRGKLKRAKMKTPKQNHQISTTSKYVVADMPSYRKTLKELGIKYLILDESHNLGVTGLLIANAQNINLFIEKVVQPNETVQIHTTPQDGLRQLTFQVDEQQKTFMRLMIDAWSNQEVNVMDMLKREQDRALKNMRETRNAYLKQLAGQFKSQAQMTNEKIHQGLFSFLAKDVYRQLLMIPDVASVSVQDNKIIVDTHDVYVREAKLRPRATQLRCYNLGKMRIVIDPMLTSEPVQCLRIDGPLPKSDGLLQAPHVDKDGVPFWGLQELRIIELLAKTDIASVLKETMKFLQVAKLDDARGVYVQYLPEVDILELPQLERSRKEQKERWLEEQKHTSSYEEIILTQTADPVSAKK